MIYSVNTARQNYRERVVAFLAFLTSDACMEACRQRIGPARLSEALCHLWFDEIYVPGERYLHSLKGDRDATAIRRFEHQFTDDELATLERFHGCLELRLDLAVNRVQGRALFPENDSWRSIRRDAAHLLDDLAPDPALLRTALAGLVMALLQQNGVEPTLDGTSLRALLEP